VSKVVDANGNVLYRAHPRRTRVWSPQTAYVVLDMMHGTVMDRKPYWALSWRASVPGRWIAGKTGTTDKERDIWFVGATPGMVAAVWIGNDDDTPMPRHMKLADGTDQLVTSSQQPIYAFNRFVSGALRGHSTDPNGFPVPPGIVFRTINLKTGALDPTGTKAAFEAGSALTSGSLLGGGTLRIAVDSATGLRATAATPPDRIRVISVDPKNVGALFPTNDAAGPSASAQDVSPGSSPSTPAGGSSGQGVAAAGPAAAPH
jgi:membrane peptidoglycan carboxypeptidase